ncbi:MULTISPECIES: hypothetical protein [Streptomyces]|uniref:hypothetical protein n=1 Tax=Streptomyces TaxID=1883 RepID=UPI0035DF34C1
MGIADTVGLLFAILAIDLTAVTALHELLPPRDHAPSTDDSLIVSSSFRAASTAARSPVLVGPVPTGRDPGRDGLPHAPVPD